MILAGPAILQALGVSVLICSTTICQLHRPKGAPPFRADIQTDSSYNIYYMAQIGSNSVHFCPLAMDNYEHTPLFTDLKRHCLFCLLRTAYHEPGET